jgi:DNA-binding CsgD family transcriptional regulator
MKVEIFTTSDGVDLVAQQGPEFRKLNENDALIELIDNTISERYPIASKRLTEKYQESFCRVRRFCKCNFGVNDHVPDIDGKDFNFEFVPCPMRGECEDENIICNPTLETGLTVRETEVVKEFAQGKLAKEVAVVLRITQKTAETHKRHIYTKLGINTIGELATWCYSNKITH